MNNAYLQKKFYTLTPEATLAILDTSEYGLSVAESARRLEQFGFNTLAEKKSVPLLFIFIKQFHNVLVYILFGASAISFYFYHIVDALVILAVVLLNAIFGFVQEYRSEKAIVALKKLVKNKAKVIRDGSMHEVEVSNIVPGDILFLEAGDKIPADGRIIQVNNLLVNEASLTGESLAQHKDIIIQSSDTFLAQNKNMVYSGTVVAGGEARIVVTATGNHTELGHIAHDVQFTDFRGSRFMDKVNQLAKNLGLLAIIGSIIIMLAGVLDNLDLFNILLLGVASAVSSIPEGLPVVLVVVLAIGVQRMAKQNAIVKHLSSVEPLGMATVICTDKTGTLTQNVMTVTEIYSNNKIIKVDGIGYSLKGSFWHAGKKINTSSDKNLYQMLTVGALANHANVIVHVDSSNVPEVVGDPTEVALVVAAHKAGLKKTDLTVDYEVVDSIPFNSDLKFQAVLFKNTNNKDNDCQCQLGSIGAYEVLLPRASHIFWEDEIRPLGNNIKHQLQQQYNELASRGHRIIAVAAKSFAKNKTEIITDDVDGMVILGFFSIIDPPREEVTSAIAQAKDAGIRVIMITGDSQKTAVAIAQQVGILDMDTITSLDKIVYTDKDLVNMSASDFNDLAKRVVILARVSPNTKLRLVQALQEQGEVVAMTGDGVNDAPALKAADVGVAMGKVGTDVARETAEIVLSDDNFASLVRAIKQGRIVFNNIRKTTGYLVTTNVGELLTLAVVLAVGLPLPLLPIHILLINLLTDGLPVVSLAFERDHGDVLKRKPFKRNTPIINREIIHLMIINSLLMVGGTLLVSYSLLKFEFSAESVAYGRTMAFVVIAMFQAWNMFNMRSINKSIFSLGFFSNKFVNWAFIFSIMSQLILFYVPPIRQIFDFVALSGFDWMIIVILTFSVIILVELYKYFMFKEKRFINRVY